jgi:hypothetical protein
VAYLEITGTPSAADGTVAATVCLRAASGAPRVGSYQGEVRYDPAQVEIVRVDRMPGGMRVDNVTRPGRLLFAGANPSGFGEPVLLRLRLRPRAGRAAAPALELQVREVSAVGGGDLTPRVLVVPAGSPRSPSPSVSRARGASSRAS